MLHKHLSLFPSSFIVTLTYFIFIYSILNYSSILKSPSIQQQRQQHARRKRLQLQLLRQQQPGKPLLLSRLRQRLEQLPLLQFVCLGYGFSLRSYGGEVMANTGAIGMDRTTTPTPMEARTITMVRAVPRTRLLGASDCSCGSDCACISSGGGS